MEDTPQAQVADIVYGIRHSVMKADEIQKDIEDKDYTLDAKESYSLLREKRSFFFKDYAPKVFGSIRKLLGVSANSFLESWPLPNEDAEFKESTARSGSMFYTTNDKKYIFKTILHPEVQVMMGILHDYHTHLQAYRKTFMVRIYGLFRYMSGSTKIWVLIMGHTFPPIVSIKEKYDLKGRKPKPGKSVNERPIINLDFHAPQKDNQIKRSIRFVDEHKNFYITQLMVDIELLKNHDIMDYSLLIGIHEVSDEEFDAAVIQSAQDEEYFSLLPTEIRSLIEKNESYIRIKSEREQQKKVKLTETDSSKTLKEKNHINASEGPSTSKKKKHLTVEKLEGIVSSETTPANNNERQKFKKSDRKSYHEKKHPRAKSGDLNNNNSSSEKPRKKKKDTGKQQQQETKNSDIIYKTIFDYGLVAIHPQTEKFEILFIGIIDNLTNYTVSKQMANLFKSALWEAETLSTVPSSYYGDRFCKFLTSSLLGDDSGPQSDDDEPPPPTTTPPPPPTITTPPPTATITPKATVTVVTTNEAGKTHSLSQPLPPHQIQTERLSGTLTPRENHLSKQKSLPRQNHLPYSEPSTQKEKQRASMGPT